MIWNKFAYDYSQGIIIYHPITLEMFTDEQARQQSKEIRSILCVMGRIQGCYVKEISELKI